MGRLAHAARTISTGNLHTDILITRDDEISELTTAMNTMALQLQSSTVSRDFFELMIDSMRDAVLAFGKDGELLHSNVGARHILGLL